MEPKLNIREVSFERVFNLGNYESMRVGLVATVSDEQDFQQVIKALDAETVKYRKAREA